MRRIKGLLFGFLAGLTGLWAMSAVWPATATIFSVRGVAVDYTGLLALAVMSAAMLLALRPAALETVTGGVDKGYRLHKWLGISGLVLAVSHWLWAEGPKWLVGLGWLVRPERGPRSEPASALEAFLRSQRGLAEDVGEWAFYIIAVLIVLALIKAVPYHWFKRLHRVFPVVYLALVVHGALLMPLDLWAAPVGWVMAALMTGGSVAAVLSLTGRIGRSRKAVGRIAHLARLEDGILSVTVRLNETAAWAGHKAGQFAFVSFDRHEGAHPFTIASAWTGDGHLTFLIKALGDYTGALSRTLVENAQVTVEGPYGRFDFETGRKRQVWVAGGIGITPFLARLEALAAGAGSGSGETVDLFYTAAAPEPSVAERLRTLSAAAGVRLHVMQDATDGLLSAGRLRELVPDLPQAEVWFCGPAGFGQALRRGLGTGIPVHQELFEMR